MKLFIVAICLLSSLAFSSCAQSPEQAKPVLDCIATRTSVRSFKATPVPEELIQTMLRAAMAAPSAVNKQPWRFIVIESRATLDTIAANFSTMRHAAKAPLAIVVAADMNSTLPGDAKLSWVADCSAATENLLLAAHACGLGATWCGVFPRQSRIEPLSKLLELPENIIPLNVVVIGYPDKDNAPKDKWKPENIHREKWNNH